MKMLDRLHEFGKKCVLCRRTGWKALAHASRAFIADVHHVLLGFEGCRLNGMNSFLLRLKSHNSLIFIVI